MEFIVSRGLTPVSEKIESLNALSIEPSAFTFHHAEDDFQVFVKSHNIERTEDKKIFLFDGQCSWRGIYFHWLNGIRSDLLARFITEIFSGNMSVTNGTFCAGELRWGLDRGLDITTDWLGAYPIYYWNDGQRYAISNNILFLEESIGNLNRSLLPSVFNIATGGSLGATHIESIERLPIGKYISAGTTLRILQRTDHEFDQIDYETAIRLAHSEIASHSDAVLRSVSSETNLTIDLTGGSDSRAVLSFLLRSAELKRIRSRSLTQYPSPDANVAGFLMQQYGINAARVPVIGQHREKSVRQNAALSGGGRDSGGIGSPISIPDFVQFKGYYGEIGGATPGIDYVKAAVESGHYSHARSTDIYLEHRAKHAATELVTAAALAHVRDVMCRQLEEISRQGIQPDQLIAELYLRNRCRTHFGLMSYLDNKNRISPEILANRWLVEARRSLPSELHKNNKVIHDLILLNKVPELAYAPMANKKWHPSLIPGEHKHLYDQMLAITTKHENLSDIQGPLYKRVAIKDPDKKPYIPLLPASTTSNNPVHAQSIHIDTYQKFLGYFVENLYASNNVWRYFDRDIVTKYVTKEASTFLDSGADINAMGAVAAGIAWHTGLELNPAILQEMKFPE